MWSGTEEEIQIPEKVYVKRVLVAGQPLRKKAKEFRKVTRLIKIEGVEGFVQVGCLVESFPKKEEAVFFILMTQLQAVQFARIFPKDRVYINDDESGWMVIIDWQQYSHLIWGRK